MTGMMRQCVNLSAGWYDSRTNPRFVVILPITHSAPSGDTVGIEIPAPMRAALGLDDERC
jgi:hypothetical protein